MISYNKYTDKNEGLRIGYISKPPHSNIKSNKNFRGKTVSFDENFPDIYNNESEKSQWYNELKISDSITFNFMDNQIETHKYEAVYFYKDITFVNSKSHLSSMVKTSIYYGKVVIVPSNTENIVDFIKSYIW